MNEFDQLANNLIKESNRDELQEYIDLHYPADEDGSHLMGADYWREHGINTPEKLELYLISSEYSDYYKSVHGFRPRHGDLPNAEKWGIDEYKKRIKELDQRREWEREHEREEERYREESKRLEDPDQFKSAKTEPINKMSRAFGENEESSRSISVPNFLDNPAARTVVKMGDEEVALYWSKRSHKFVKAVSSNPRVNVSVKSLNRYIREWDKPDITLTRVVAASMSEPGAEDDSNDRWIDGAHEDKYAGSEYESY